MIFPAIWLFGMGAGALCVGLGAVTPPLPDYLHIIFPILWLVGVGLMACLCFPLKHVYLESTGLQVGGLWSTIMIPLSEVEAVSASSGTNPEIITVRLKRRCAFGRKIRFMPSYRFNRLSPHPTYALLSKAVGAQATGKEPT